MTRRSTSKSALLVLVAAALLVLSAPAVRAAESDLWTGHTAPNTVAAGSMVTVEVSYGNLGPDAAASAYINSYVTPPMGLDVILDDLFNGPGQYYDAIESSAVGTDTLGNAALLFWDDYFCEDLLFQLQRDDGDPDADPVEGLDPGVTASFTYDVMIPMERPRTGTVEITEPTELVQAWTGTNPLIPATLIAAELGTYGRASCDTLVGGPEDDVCEFVDDNCFGGRVALLADPIEAEWELVDDGSADPTLGCDPLVGFTPGNIALVRRGSCEFGDKGFNAEVAGAAAVVLVNDGRCSDYPDSDQCVINMAAGTLGGLITIPIILLPQADGEPIITAVESGQTVRGVLGSSTLFSAEGYAFLSDSQDEDPVVENDFSQTKRLLYGEGCEYEISPETSVFSSAAGNGGVTVTTDPECPWDVLSDAPWVSVTLPAHGQQGNGLIVIDVTQNIGSSRAAAIRVANQVHYVQQAEGNGCPISVSPAAVVLPGGSAEGTITVATPGGCSWTAESAAPWVELTSPAEGVGPGTVDYRVDPNPYGPRSGAVLVGDSLFRVSQTLLVPGLIFTDDFHTGTTDAWSAVVP